MPKFWNLECGFFSRCGSMWVFSPVFRTQVAITTHGICSTHYLSGLFFFFFSFFPFGSPILLKSSALLWFLFKELAYVPMSICRKKTKSVLKRSQLLESFWLHGTSSGLGHVYAEVKIHHFLLWAWNSLPWLMKVRLSLLNNRQVMDTTREPLTEQEPTDGQSV